MAGIFFKNTTFMYSGILFEIFIGLLSLAIYIRELGIESYMVVGIVMSFFGMVSRIDIPFFLTLIKNNSRAHEEDKEYFRKVFNTLYNSLLISNIAILFLLIPAIIFLSFKAYGSPDLMPFYLIVLFTLLFSRVNLFLKNFLRANGNEVAIQKVVVPSLTVGFLVTLTFMFLFDFGVISIFMGVFIQNILEYALLKFFTRDLVEFSPYFSLAIFTKIFRKYTIHEHIAKVLNVMVIFAGLFVSTFFLDAKSIGILTILVIVTNRIWEFSSLFSVHLGPILSYEIVKKNYDKIRKIINNTATFLIFLAIASIIFLSTIGEKLYSLYFGSNLDGTYYLFLWLIFGILLSLCSAVAYRYILIFDIVLYNKMMVLLSILFFAVLFPMMGYLGILGVVITYFAFQSLKAAVFLVFTRNKVKGSINNGILAQLAIVLIALTTSLFINSNTHYFLPVLVAILSIPFLFFSAKFGELIRATKYIIHEIR